MVGGGLWQFEAGKVIALRCWKCSKLLREYENEENDTVLGGFYRACNAFSASIASVL